VTRRTAAWDRGTPLLAGSFAAGLYRAIDRDGALVDVMLSEHRNPIAARRFFRSAKMVTGVIPDRATRTH